MGDSMGIFMGYSSNRGRWVCRHFNLLIFGEERMGSMMKNHWILGTPSMLQQGELVLVTEPALGIAKKIRICYLDRMVTFFFSISWWNYRHFNWGIPPTHGQTYQILSEYPHPWCLNIDQFKDSKTNQVSCEIQILDTSRWSNPWFSSQKVLLRGSH